MRLLLIGLGGFLGANARYLLGLWVAQWASPGFPWGTLLINSSGSFVIGLLLPLLTDRLAAPEELRLLFVVGFLGAYTTFSTFTYDSLALLRSGDYLPAFANMAGSLLLGMGAVLLGWLTSQWIS